MRVLITGSRTWPDPDFIKAVLSEYDTPDTVLISGHCPTGADAMCEAVAISFDWAIERYPADWKRYGRRAGFVRNEFMVTRTSPDIALAFIHNNSRGATHTADLAERHNVPLIRFNR